MGSSGMFDRTRRPWATGCDLAATEAHARTGPQVRDGNADHLVSSPAVLRGGSVGWSFAAGELLLER